MMPASELKVTRVISKPGILQGKKRDYWVSGSVKIHLGKKGSCGPVATLSRVMMAMKGKRAFMTSRETFERGKGKREGGNN